jgi:cell wall-associated NlpC family hydrolase
MSSATRALGAVGVGLMTGVLTLGVAPLADAATRTVMTATTTVNIRSGPTTSAAVRGELERGQRIAAVGRLSGTWVKVRLTGSSAYIAKKYLTTDQDLPAAPTAISTTGTKTATANLNVRTGPAPHRMKVGVLREGTTLTLTGRLSHGYAQTSYAGHLRWVTQQYLATVRPSAPVTVAPVAAPVVGTQGERALAFAKRQLGKPYKWGAVGPKAYDCSGLVLASWKSVGVTLPRTARQQFRGGGQRIAKADLRAGDLVFFYGSRPHHVAMYVGDGVVIHAPRPGKRVQYIKMTYMPYSGAVRPG